MHRRSFLRYSTVLAGASLVTRKNALAQIFRTTAYNIQMLRGNIGIFTERGGTIGFGIANEGLVVIDAQFPDTAAHFIDEAKKKNNAPFRYLLNTHHHGDHTAGNIAFKGAVEHVLAHENSLANQKRVAEQQNGLDKVLLPDTTFQQDTKVKIGKIKIKGYYFGPGHTNGDAVYLFEEENIVHMGDLVFNRRHPFVDRSAGASIRSWITVLEKTRKEFNNKTMYVFGHSLETYPVTGTADDLLKFQDYLDKVLRFTEGEIKRGVSKEEFIKNTSIPGVTEWTGDGIQRPLTAAYEELTAGK